MTFCNKQIDLSLLPMTLAMLSRAYPMLLCDLACVRADYPVATLPYDAGPEFVSSEGLEGYQEIIEHILY